MRWTGWLRGGRGGPRRNKTNLFVEAMMSTFPELHAAARAHQKPKFDAPDLVVNNTRGDRAPMATIPTRAAPELAPRPSSINDPATKPPADVAQGFDPNGPGLLSVSLRHPLDAVAAGTLAAIAWRVAEQQYPGNAGGGGGHNQEGDAFRHAYWNSTMAKSLVADRAQQFANALEISSPNRAGERQMDLYNNSQGRALASRSGPMVDIIKQAIADGKIRTRPF